MKKTTDVPMRILWAVINLMAQTSRSRYTFIVPISSRFPRNSNRRARRDHVHGSDSYQQGTPDAPQPIGPYEQAIKANGFVYAAGQIALVPESGELVAGGVGEQARQVLDNVTAVLEAAGTSWDRAVKTTIYLNDMADFAAVNAIYESYLGSGKPARTTVAVAGLPKGALVEVDVVAPWREPPYPDPPSVPEEKEPWGCRRG